MSASHALLSRTHQTDDEQPFLTDDPSSIRLLALPEIGPPFDDDPAARAVAGAANSAGGGAEAAAAPAGQRPGHTGAASGPSAGPDGPDGDWARQFASLLTEALSGARPVRQILPCTSERARVQLRALMPLFAGGQRPRLLRVIATRPTRDVIEMTVIAGLGTRTRALAVRLQLAEPARRPGWLSPAAAVQPRQASALPRWLCTDIEAA
jgi:Family of unknown function (DUF6459)